MNLHEYVLLAASSLFVILDPIAIVPAFLAMTPNDSPQDRIRMARMACMIAAIILLIFATTGKLIFNFFGITIPAFQIAGSIVLLLVALDMLRARRSAVQETIEETDAGAAKADIAVTPLAVPMLAGPGAISTVMVLALGSKSWVTTTALYVSIALTALISFLTLSAASLIERRLGQTGMRILTRLMGLVLCAIAVQFIIDGLKMSGVVTHPP